jgi:glycosyltransferase involved in cell wall biosynthesis
MMPRNFEPFSLPALPEQPLFSVLVRNHNYARYVGVALQSVLDQTYRNFEVIVCDDGSTDNSREVIAAYVRKDSRVRLVEQKNGGVASAANTAYEQSKGELIAFLDSDDLFKPRKLETVLRTFESNPRSGFCVDRIQPFSDDGQALGPPYPPNVDYGWIGPEKLRQGSLSFLPPVSGLAFRREIAAHLFPIPVQLERLEDCYLCTAQFLTEISLAPECLTEYRVHPAHITGVSGDKPRPFWTMFEAEGHIRFVHDLEKVVPLQKALLSRVYGPSLAEGLRLEDHQGYWDALLGIRVLRGSRAGAIRPYTIRQMIGHVRRPANKRVWRAITRLPDPLARRAYCFWRGSSPLKQIVKRTVLPLIRG